MPSNAPSYDAAQMLIAASICTLSGSWPAKVGRFTTSPDAQVACVDTPGKASNPRWLLDEPGLMILVRGDKDKYLEAWAKGKAVKDKLLGMDPITLASADRWDGVLMQSDLSFLAYDELSRPTFSLNFRLIIEPAVANSPLTSRDPL